MGDDWAGKFDHLNHLCEVVYLPRTDSVSSSIIKSFVKINSGRPSSFELRFKSQSLLKNNDYLISAAFGYQKFSSYKDGGDC